MRICDVEGCGKIHFGKGLCHNHYNKKRIKDNPEIREKNRIRSLAWYNHPTNKANQKNRVLIQRRNMTIDEYNGILKLQNFKCAICGVDQSSIKDALHVDHDHSCCTGDKSCGKCTRGLLCNKCNTSIGGFGDSTELLDRAANYLREYQSKKAGVSW